LVTEFEQKIENKRYFTEARTLDDQEWHLALEMPTSRTAHTVRERENTSVKQHQGKG
jgi:3-phenylpropionate/cinnamic acid dioxygenase small subunit